MDLRFIVNLFSIFLAVALTSGNGNILDKEDLQIPEQNGVKNVIDDFILLIINKFKSIITDGNDCLGIPVLDPLEIPALHLNISSALLKMNGNVTNIYSEGLKNLHVTNVTSNIIKLTVALEMVMPELYISGDYDVNGLAALIFPIYGEGPFFVRVADINIDGLGTIGILPGGFANMKELDFTLEIGEITAHFDGLLGGGEFGEVVNQIVNELSLTIYDRVREILHDTLMTAMLAFINDQLEGVLLADLIAGIIQPLPGNCTIIH